MARLDLANLKDLQQELELRKIKTASIAEIYSTEGKDVPYTSFSVVTTAIDPATGLILRHVEKIGRSCSLWDADMKKLSKESLDRGKKTRKELEKKGIRVIHGEFKEGGG